MIYFHCTTARLDFILAEGLLARSPSHPSSVYHNQENLHDQPEGVYCCSDLKGTARWGADIMVHAQYRDLTIIAFECDHQPEIDGHDPAGQALYFGQSIEPAAIVASKTLPLEALRDWAESKGQAGWEIIDNMKWFGPFIAQWLEVALEDFCYSLTATNVQKLSTSEPASR